MLAHRGDPKKNHQALKFQIQWKDGDVTWQKWGDVKKLSAVDDIRNQRGRELKDLLCKS